MWIFENQVLFIIQFQNRLTHSTADQSIPVCLYRDSFKVNSLQLRYLPHSNLIGRPLINLSTNNKRWAHSFQLIKYGCSAVLSPN